MPGFLMSLPFLGLHPATPRWDADNMPEDPVSGDVYFSRDDGLAETRTVFLAGCDLPARWQDRNRHVICETGFGTGLNFLATWDLWRQSRKEGQRLHFISVEAHPFSRADLVIAHEQFPELANLSRSLRAQWPPAVRGMHRLYWPQDNITLTLLLGDVARMLGELDAEVDSWFLDGFAPSKNPDMWSDKLFAQMAHLSAPGAQVGTYTVAGAVRRGLAAQGFSVERLPGHGRKRQRLHAVYGSLNSTRTARPETAIVIGAGIAGACLARCLRRNGIDVAVVDQAGPASAASGNPKGLVNPRLDLSDQPTARFHRAAFMHAVQLYQRACPHAFEAMGIVRRARSAADRKKQVDLVQAQALPARWAELTDDGLLLPQAGTLDPKTAISALLNGVEFIQRKATKLEWCGDGWSIRDENGSEIKHTKCVFLANGAFPFAMEGLPPLRLLRGQVSVAHIPGHGLVHGETGASYCLPLDADHVLFGATHDKVEANSQDERTKDHERNLAAFAAMHPGLAGGIAVDALAGRAATRSASPDQQPVAGPAPDMAQMPNWLHSAKGKHPDLFGAPALPGVFMLNGLGSRGLTLAPLAAEMVVAQALGLPVPVERSAQQALHPARFALRQYRRGETPD